MNLNPNPKLRSDSVFAQLTVEQIEVLEDWLFEEKLSYKEVIGKLQQEFGLKTSQTALGRFFQRLSGERIQERQLAAMASCLEVLAMTNGDRKLQEGLFVLASMQAVSLMQQPMASVKEFTGFLRAWTSAAGAEAKRAEAHRLEEERKQAEKKKKEAEEQEARQRQLWIDRDAARIKAREAKRQATLAAKKAAATGKAGETSNIERVTSNVEVVKLERLTEEGLAAGESATPSESVTNDAIPERAGQFNEDLTINWGDQKPRKTA